MAKTDQQMSQIETDVEEQADRLAAFINALDKVYRDRVMARAPVEQIWLEDLRQHAGIYEQRTLNRIREVEGSEIFVNLTLPKTSALAARISDLLFPTDDKNWGIQPTPVPELQEDLKERQRVVQDAKESAAHYEQEMVLNVAAHGEESPEALQSAQQLQDVQDTLSEAERALDVLQETMRAARDKAHLMEAEIEDALVESGYAGISRRVIEDATKVGIGVMKGPVTGTTMRKSWDIDEAGNYTLRMEVDDTKPEVGYVDYWSFFPDPNKRNPADGEGVYERHLMNAKQLRRLARQTDMNEDVIRSILSKKPTTTQPAFVASLRAMGTETRSTNDEAMYEVVEYTGPIDHEELDLLAEAFNDDGAKELAEKADPLTEISAKVWFCEGKLLSFGLHPLDSAETIYSTYVICPDEHGPWGRGIPRLCRNSQAIVNGAARMMMDNAGYATTPIIEIDKSVLDVPQGGVAVRARTRLQRKSTADPNRPALRQYNIASHQQELEAIMALGKQLIDEETGIPTIAQGEQGAMTTKTASGMALLMNSANVIYRRFVKAWDDNITVPLLGRMYDYLMQFSDKTYIKGDYNIDARGSSVLMVREMQGNNLFLIAQVFGDHPIYGQFLRPEELMRNVFRAHLLPSDEVVKTQQEIDEEQTRAGKEPTPEQVQMQADIELENVRHENKVRIAEMEGASRLQVAEIQREIEMLRLASQEDIKLADIEARLEAIREKRKGEVEREHIRADSQREGRAVEVAMRERTGVSSGGAV